MRGVQRCAGVHWLWAQAQVRHVRHCQRGGDARGAALPSSLCSEKCRASGLLSVPTFERCRLFEVAPSIDTRFFLVQNAEEVSPQKFVTLADKRQTAPWQEAVMVAGEPHSANREKKLSD